MHVTVVGWHYDDDLRSEAELLERYTTLTGWCDALRAAGAARVTVVHRFHRDAVVHRQGVAYRFCPASDRPHATCWLPVTTVGAAVAANRPDVVHVNGLGFPLETWRLRKRLSPATALLVQDHASVPPAGRLQHVVQRRLLQAPDGFLFTAPEQADPWIRAGLISRRHRICAVPEASTSLRPIDRVRAQRESGVYGHPALLWVGRLNANKDPLCVLEAFAAIRHRWPDATLTMVFGTADLRSEVDAWCAARPALRDALRLVGSVAHRDMPAYYSAADILVLGSHHESTGYALIEACACGVAPVVTDIPAFRRLTDGGRIGRLWPVGDSRACAEAIAALAPRVGPDLRSMARAHFDRNLSWSTVGRQALHEYDRVVRDRRARLATGELGSA